MVLRSLMQPASVFEREAVLETAWFLFATLSAGLFLRHVDENNEPNLLQFKVKYPLLIFTEIWTVVAGNTVGALLAAYLCFPVKSTAVASLDKKCQRWNKQLLMP